MKYEKRINKQRQRRGFRVRNRIKRDTIRPRLSVFRTSKHLYAQIIDDEDGRTLVAASTVDKDLRGEITYGGNKDAAIAIGKALADRALKAGITAVAFDRCEYKYHGRVAALAEAAREAGLVI